MTPEPSATNLHMRSIANSRSGEGSCDIVTGRFLTGDFNTLLFPGAQNSTKGFCPKKTILELVWISLLWNQPSFIVAQKTWTVQATAGRSSIFGTIRKPSSERAQAACLAQKPQRLACEKTNKKTIQAEVHLYIEKNKLGDNQPKHCKNVQ